MFYLMLIVTCRHFITLEFLNCCLSLIFDHNKSLITINAGFSHNIEVTTKGRPIDSVTSKVYLLCSALRQYSIERKVVNYNVTRFYKPRSLEIIGGSALQLKQLSRTHWAVCTTQVSQEFPLILRKTLNLKSVLQAFNGQQ